MSLSDRPSVYTPFTRRFGNERERELRETRQLHHQLSAWQAHFPETLQSFCGRVYRDLPRLAPGHATSRGYGEPDEDIALDL